MDIKQEKNTNSNKVQSAVKFPGWVKGSKKLEKVAALCLVLGSNVADKELGQSCKDLVRGRD
jgi:hypothetical protein